jgi:hypothetical protein
MPTIRPGRPWSDNALWVFDSTATGSGWLSLGGYVT